MSFSSRGEEDKCCSGKEFEVYVVS